MKIKFGTSGWRAIISDEFTFKNVRIVSQAIAEYLKRVGGKRVIVARDTRFMTERYARLVAEVLTANGLKVLMPENPTPTPVVSFTIRHHRLDGGINITASHNPPEYCGIKFNPADGSPAPPEVTQQIESIIASLDESKVSTMSLVEANSRDLLEIFDPKPTYMDALARIVDFEAIRKANLKVIVDLMYGTAMGYLDELCSRLCKEVEVFHNYRDPYFGGNRPEPDEERLALLANRVKTKGWDAVLAVDGDADRFGIVDDEGKYIKANEVIALLAHHLYKNKNMKGPVARTVATSHAVDEVAKAFKSNVVETPVGFKFLASVLLNEKAVIAGEESGGLSVANHVPEKDGILACLLILEMIAYEGKPLSQIRKEFRQNYGTFHNTRVDFELSSDEEKRKLFERFENLERYVADLKVVSSDRIDGLRYFFDKIGSWLLVRASGTEPVVRVYFEARDEGTFQKLNMLVRKISR
ncbi:phosphoglucomutase/phosphomannomutase family protein [Thermotoga caldifontis]|uniref:phosphoglucomutase/phosphomannomutase family protein n=1 Tax=Thermotoga caldifontis TaxID=1508419 RepID=UPI000596C303|nr:phosphoglucomutase/phosphomannomutase family protein [Thermotoga caldifontis]